MVPTRAAMVNARRDAGIEQIGSEHSSGRIAAAALVAPAALGRALDPGEVMKPPLG